MMSIWDGVEGVVRTCQRPFIFMYDKRCEETFIDKPNSRKINAKLITCHSQTKSHNTRPDHAADCYSLCTYFNCQTVPILRHSSKTGSFSANFKSRIACLELGASSFSFNTGFSSNLAINIQ